MYALVEGLEATELRAELPSYTASNLQLNEKMLRLEAWHPIAPGQPRGWLSCIRASCGGRTNPLLRATHVQLTFPKVPFGAMYLESKAHSDDGQK